MTQPIANVTTAALALALDAATMRQQAISSNIANANSAGYVALGVSFEDQLDEARRRLQSGNALQAEDLAELRPELRQLRSADGHSQAVQLDLEAAKVAQNSVHFQALLKGLSRHYAVLSTAVSDGKK